MLVVRGFNYVGGVTMAKSIVHQDQAPGPPSPDNLPWCICNLCRPMEHATENVCCCQRNCITLSTTFDGVALDRSDLSVAIISRSDLFAADPDYSPASYQKAAYCLFVMRYHGHLGRGNQLVVPSCVVWRVRDEYPAPDGNYLGFIKNEHAKTQ